MSTARDFLAAVQQRAKSSGTLSELGERLVELEETTDRLVAALTAALDLHREEVSCGNPRHTNFDAGCPECLVVCDSCGEIYPCPTVRAITDALTPKENDS